MVFLAGCPGNSDLPKTYPVKGKVVDAKGAPVKGGSVMFESGQATNISIVGVIQEDGTFSLNTYRDKTELPGAPEGEYRVKIMLPITDGNNPPPPVTLPKPFRVEAKDNDCQVKLPR